MALVLLLVLLLPGVAVALYTRPFRPDPSLLPLRILVAALATTATVMLGLSLGSDWWIVHDWVAERTLVTDAGSPFVLAIVASGLLAAGLTVLGAWGRRNWAPLGLTVAWLLVAIAWYAASGEPVDFEATGEARPGLRLATWAVLLVTFTTVVASFGRLAERGTHPGPPAEGVGADLDPASPPTRSRASGWDLVAATALAILAIASVFGGSATTVVAVLAMVLVVVALRRRPARSTPEGPEGRPRPERSDPVAE